MLNNQNNINIVDDHHQYSTSFSSSSTGSFSNRSIDDLLRDDNNNSSSISISNNNNSIYNVGNNLAATIATIRTNVTRVLFMYFQNVTDEFGYGAATTTPPITNVTTTTRPTSPSASLNEAASTTTTTMSPISGYNNNNNSSAPTTTTTMSSVAAAERRSETILDYAKAWHVHLTNATTRYATTTTATTATTTTTVFPSSSSSSSPLSTTAAAINSAATTTTTAAATAINSKMLTTAPSITYPTYPIPIRTYENCSALFANYTQPQQGTFCNWTWDQYLCWPPTPAGVLARMNCPSDLHGLDTRKFANRKCELDGHWGGRPNETNNTIGWTDYQPCFKPEVYKLLQQENLPLFLEIAKRTRTLEIVGLVLSLFALILSLIIFCNFRTLRNNRTKIHKNLFIAMVLQVLVRLTLYLDQAFRRGNHEAAINSSTPGIENTHYLCEASYFLLEYARTAMFMWMFIEGLYLHNMVTVAVFQGRFPHTVFSLIGWGMPVVMTTIWAICTAQYMDSVACWRNYNLTAYYWILEGPRLIVILLNFFFLMNIIRVLVVKLRQSQASDIEQTRKAVRAAIVLLPLLGITNLLHLVPALNVPWKFALWSYVTHFLTSFQGFFIALIYCFLNGEVRTVLLKSLAVYMSVRGHPEWAPKRASMFSGAYNTAPDTEAQAQQDTKRNESPPNKRGTGRRTSATATLLQHTGNSISPRTHITANHNHNNNNNNNINHNNYSHRHSTRRRSSNFYHHGGDQTNNRRTTTTTATTTTTSTTTTTTTATPKNWLLTLCFRGQKVLRPPTSSVPPESVVFELSEQ